MIYCWLPLKIYPCVQYLSYAAAMNKYMKLMMLYLHTTELYTLIYIDILILNYTPIKWLSVPSGNLPELWL